MPTRQRIRQTSALPSVLVLGLTLVAACTGGSPTTRASATTTATSSAVPPRTPAASATRTVRSHRSAPPPDVYLDVVGRCTSAGGVLRSRSHGFTPGGKVAVSATLNDGVTDYPRLTGMFPVASDGSVRWRWSCAGAPPGRYIIQFIDADVGVVFSTTFHVGTA